LHKKHAPFTHNLTRLAELCELEYNENYFNWLDKVTYFNQNTRYDDFKREFYKQCTKEFAEEWINNIKLLQKWIKKQH
jgi:HEPN domain-containing protein